jgi:hypothetical protein
MEPTDTEPANLCFVESKLRRAEESLGNASRLADFTHREAHSLPAQRFLIAAGLAVYEFICPITGLIAE